MNKVSVSVLLVLSLLSTTSYLKAGGFNTDDATLEDIDRKLVKLSKRVATTESELANIIESQKDVLKALRNSKETEDLQGIDIATKAYNALKNARDDLRKKQSKEALQNMGGLKILPVEVLQLILSQVPLNTRFDLRVTSKGLKFHTESCPNYAQIKILRNTAKASRKYVDAVIDKLKIGDLNFSEIYELGIQARMAAKDWKPCHSLSEYESFMKSQQELQIPFASLSEESLDKLVKEEWPEAKHEKYSRLKKQPGLRDDEILLLEAEWAYKGVGTARRDYVKELFHRRGVDPQNAELSKELTIKWAFEGDKLVREHYYYNLLDGKDGHTKDKALARKLIDQWLEEGDAFAFAIQIQGLCTDDATSEGFGYSPDLDLAKEIINKRAKAGDTAARVWKCALIGGRNLPYSGNLRKLDALEKKWAEDGDQTLREIVIGNLLRGSEYYSWQSYPENPEEAYRLMRKWHLVPVDILEDNFFNNAIHFFQ